MTTTFITRVHPDPRGRIAISKALEALKKRFSKPISGFEILLSSNGDIILRPTVELPATLLLSAEEYLRIHNMAEVDLEPNAALLAAAQEYWSDIKSGKLTTYLDEPKPKTAMRKVTKAKRTAKLTRQSR